MVAKRGLTNRADVLSYTNVCNNSTAYSVLQSETSQTTWNIKKTGHTLPRAYLRSNVNFINLPKTLSSQKFYRATPKAVRGMCRLFETLVHIIFSPQELSQLGPQLSIIWDDGEQINIYTISSLTSFFCPGIFAYRYN